MRTLLAPFVEDPARHLYRMLRNPEYRTLNFLTSRYEGTPRYTPQRIKVDGWDIEVPDAASFLSAYREIFVEGIYRFPFPSGDPVIFDCGANIGLSVLYFKKLFPKSRIVAFEADPKIFGVLERNVRSNRIEGVELVDKAVWTADTTLNFSSEGADAGRIDTGGDAGLTRVPAVRLASLLEKQRVDFLKMDIEGAEVEVLADCATQLGKLRYAFVEFHSFRKRPKQRLGELIELFESQGFRTHVHSHQVAKSPFWETGDNMGMDMQLNVFFWRPE